MAAITVASNASSGASLFTIQLNDITATKTINESLEIIRSYSDSNCKLTFAFCSLEIEKGKQCRMQLARRRLINPSRALIQIIA